MSEETESELVWQRYLDQRCKSNLFACVKFSQFQLCLIGTLLVSHFFKYFKRQWCEGRIFLLSLMPAKKLQCLLIGVVLSVSWEVVQSFWDSFRFSLSLTVNFYPSDCLFDGDKHDYFNNSCILIICAIQGENKTETWIKLLS